MNHFAILPTDQSCFSVELEARDAAAVLNKMVQLGCTEADVLENGRYAFSARIDTAGIWNIYQNKDAMPLPR